MKKLFLSMMLLVFATSIFAQDVIESTETTQTKEPGAPILSKRGEPFLPEAGDWAISFDATPVFTYVGNAFNGNTNNSAPGVDWLNNDRTIVGKYFLDDKTAIRGILRIGFGNRTTKANIADATVTTFPNFPALFPTVEDKWTAKSTTIGIGAGYEMRKGKTRLQGYYGADAMVWMSTYSDKFAYGNKIADDVAVVAYTTDFSGPGGVDNITTDTYFNDARIKEQKAGTTFGFGVRGFIGAEYFVFPKIAIGAEYGWGVGFQKTGEGKEDGESVNADGTVGSYSQKTPGSSSFGVDTDLNQGNIFGFSGSNTGSATLRVTFHF